MLLQSLSYQLPWQNHLVSPESLLPLTQKSCHGLRYWNYQATSSLTIGCNRLQHALVDTIARHNDNAGSCHDAVDILCVSIAV